MRNVGIKEVDGTDKTDAATVKKGAEVKKIGLISRRLNLVPHHHLLLHLKSCLESWNPRAIFAQIDICTDKYLQR